MKNIRLAAAVAAVFLVAHAQATSTQELIVAICHEHATPVACQEAVRTLVSMTYTSGSIAGQCEAANVIGGSHPAIAHYRAAACEAAQDSSVLEARAISEGK
ncbi:hypothetical protein V8N76_004543 [Salmonella enterica]